LTRRKPRVYTQGMTKRVGANVRKWRQARGLTQGTLAERVGISRVFLAYVEGHQKTPSLATLERLARVLKVTMADLVK